jgi:hypothetical protein
MTRAMTLVLETSPDVDPEADSSLGELLQQANFIATGREVFDEHCFHYYESKSLVNSDQLLANLTKTPLVKAAYFKSGSAPPAM